MQLDGLCDGVQSVSNFSLISNFKLVITCDYIAALPDSITNLTVTSADKENRVQTMKIRLEKKPNLCFCSHFTHSRAHTVDLIKEGNDETVEIPQV